jgi:hypothetical protein
MAITYIRLFYRISPLDWIFLVGLADDDEIYRRPLITTLIFSC